MRRSIRHTPHQPGPCQPRLERLESRLTLSASVGVDPSAMMIVRPAAGPDTAAQGHLGATLSVVSTDPAPGTTLASTPKSVSVVFDRPIDAFSLSLSGDVVIEVQDGAAWAPTFDALHSPSESLDATGTALTLTLGRSLPQGTYRLVIPGAAGVVGSDGTLPSADGSDLVLGRFTVARAGVTLAEANVIASPAAGSVSVAGTLDLRADPAAVKLYKFTLPAGHLWRVGAEVVAQNGPLALRSAVAVFDAEGRPVAVSSSGRSSTPGNAFLFVGLEPGTYYLGVSGQGNLPGSGSGYDPATGRQSATNGDQSGGPFRLDVVADPADEPTRLLGASLIDADPASPSPTGFTLTFNGALDLGTLRGSPSAGIRVVGEDGRTVPATAIGYQEGTGQYAFQFDQALPAGRYSVIVPEKSEGGATDLAGRTPVAPGQQPGVLATFRVRETAAAADDPRDLGALFDLGETGVSRDAVVEPGTGVSFRFVVLNSGVYTLSDRPYVGSASIRLSGPNGLTEIAAGRTGVASRNLLILNPGVYFLQFVNAGATAASVSWSLNQSTHADSQLDNGIGQGSALSMRLVSPTLAPSAPPAPSASGPNRPAPDSPTAWQPPGTTLTPAPVPTPASVASNATATVANPVTSPAAAPIVAPGGLYLTTGNTLVGRPSTQADHVAAVSPEGATALASSATGLPQGIDIVARTSARFSWGRAEVEPARGEDGLSADALPARAEPVNGALVVDAGVDVPQADRAVIVAADLLARVGRLASRWLMIAPSEPADDPAAGPEATAEPIVLARDDSPAEPPTGRVEQAQIGTPLAVGLAAMMALRGQPSFLHWLRRSRVETSKKGSPAGSPFRGPHRRV